MAHDERDLWRMCRRASADDFALPGAEKHYPPDLELEPVHVDIDLAIDLERSAASGVVTTTVEARRAGPRRLVLDAVSFLDVGANDLDGGETRFAYDGRRIEVVWTRPFAEAERRRVAVRYRVVEPATGLLFSKPSADSTDLPWFAATDHETERARHWLPSIDLPSARPRIDFRLRADRRFTILAGGVLVGEIEHDDGTKTAHWRLDVPCPSYIACFAIGEFVRYDDEPYDGGEVSYFATPPATPADLARSFGKTPAMLRWIAERLGQPFPFPKYYQFAVPDICGAMENISLVSWDDLYVLDEILASEREWLVDRVNIHEMAHAYFGDAIVCRDFAHAWLKESWATYMEQVWLEETRSPEDADYVHYTSARSYFKEAQEKYNRPIVTRRFSSSWDLYDRHLYPGGACRLHMLRAELGDATFWGAVREYVRTCMGSVVETDDFRRALETYSGRSLGRFFDQWFHSPGYPKVRAEYEWDGEKGEATIRLEQMQASTDEGVGLFDLPLEVAWMDQGRWRTTEILFDRERAAVVLTASSDPEQVRIDPGRKLLIELDFNPGDAKVRRQLREAPDVQGRILAANELAKTATRENLEAILAAYPSEPFWGVRLEWARALSGAESGISARGLAELVKSERDPRVLEGLFRAAGRYRDPAVKTALLARLEEPLPYLATAALYEALGAQREDAPYELLERAARTPSPRGIAQSGALRGLAATRRAEALATILDRLPRQAANFRVRPAAAEALAELGRHLETPLARKVETALVELLRDERPRVRLAAVRGLAGLGAAGAIRPLEAYSRGLSVQDRVDVEHAIRRIRKSTEPAANARDKDLDDLRARVRKLSDRVDELEGRLPNSRRP